MHIAKLKKIDCLAYGLVALYVVIFVLLSFGRHDALKSYLNDLGSCDQLVWNTLHGHFFDNSANMLNQRNYLGSHFSLIFLVFVPLYALLATPKWLLLGQVLAVGASALVVYFFGKELFNDAKIALVFLLSYLLYPVLHNALLYDFHEVVFAVPFAAAAFYCLWKEKYGWFVFWSVLLCASQEQLPLLVFMLGLAIMFIKKKTRLGALVCFFSLAYFIVALTVFIPHFSSSGTSALLSSSSPYPSRYAWLGSNVSEVIRNIATHPVAIFQTITSTDRLQYLFLLVAPVFSLALFAWPIMLIAPLVGINLLSSNSMTFSIFFYHGAIYVPFIYFAAMLTFKRWFFDSLSLRYLFLALILGCSIAGAVLFSATPLSRYYRWADFIPTPHEKALADAVRLIPADASLSVQDNLGPHVSERSELYRFPQQQDSVQYILLDQYDPYRDNPNQIFGFEYALQMTVPEQTAAIDELKQSPNYELLYDRDGYLLFHNKNK